MSPSGGWNSGLASRLSTNLSTPVLLKVLKLDCSVLLGRDAASHPNNNAERLRCWGGWRLIVNTVMRRLFDNTEQEVTGGWEEVHNDELLNLYPSPNKLVLD
jgi:hypothetical protein